MKGINSKCCWHLAKSSLWINSQEPCLWETADINLQERGDFSAWENRQGRHVWDFEACLASGCCPSHSLTYAWGGKNVCALVKLQNTLRSLEAAVVPSSWSEQAEPSCSLWVFGGAAVPVLLGSADGTEGWWGHKALLVVHATVNVWNTNLAWNIFYRNIYGKNFIFLKVLCEKCLFLSSYWGCFTSLGIPNAAVAAVSVRPDVFTLFYLLVLVVLKWFSPGKSEHSDDCKRVVVWVHLTLCPWGHTEVCWCQKPSQLLEMVVSRTQLVSINCHVRPAAVMYCYAG